VCRVMTCGRSRSRRSSESQSLMSKSLFSTHARLKLAGFGLSLSQTQARVDCARGRRRARSRCRRITTRSPSCLHCLAAHCACRPVAPALPARKTCGPALRVPTAAAGWAGCLQRAQHRLQPRCTHFKIYCQPAQVAQHGAPAAVKAGAELPVAAGRRSIRGHLEGAARLVACCQ
jgi:hypothetical protein